MLVLTWAVCVLIAVLAALTMLVSKRARRVGPFLILVPVGIVGGSYLGFIATYFLLAPAGSAAAAANSEHVAWMSNYFGGIGGGIAGGAIGFAAVWLILVHPRPGVLRSFLVSATATLVLVTVTIVAGIVGAVVISTRRGAAVGWDIISFGRWGARWFVGIFILLLVSEFFRSRRRRPVS